VSFYKKGKNWYIDYYAHGRRRREKVGPHRKLAETVLQKRKVSIAEGKYLDIKKAHKIRFEHFAEDYFRLHSKLNKKPSAIKTDTSLLKTLKAYFGGRYLYTITPVFVEEYKSKRSASVKPATVNKELACLKTLFNKAIQWGKCTENPVKKVKLLRENNQRLRYLEKEEIKKLLAVCFPHLKPIVTLALNTGMRKGEILKLKWHDIHIKSSLIYLTDTKNNEIRKVPINDIVRQTLVEIPKHPDSPYVFCNKNGKPYTDVKKSFFTAMKKSGIVDFRFHDLRHTFASHLVMAGIDIKTVQELMGHKSIEMTLRYSHLSPSHKQRAVDILGKKMDTIWTPVAKSKKFSDEPLCITIDISKSNEISACSSIG